jgi:hypothetical protein
MIPLLFLQINSLINDAANQLVSKWEHNHGQKYYIGSMAFDIVVLQLDVDGGQLPVASKLKG